MVLPAINTIYSIITCSSWVLVVPQLSYHGTPCGPCGPVNPIGALRSLWSHSFVSPGTPCGPCWTCQSIGPCVSLWSQLYYRNSLGSLRGPVNPIGPYCGPWSHSALYHPTPCGPWDLSILLAPCGPCGPAHLYHPELLAVPRDLSILLALGPCGPTATVLPGTPCGPWDLSIPIGTWVLVVPQHCIPELLASLRPCQICWPWSLWSTAPVSPGTPWAPCGLLILLDPVVLECWNFYKIREHYVVV